MTDPEVAPAKKPEAPAQEAAPKPEQAAPAVNFNLVLDPLSCGCNCHKWDKHPKPETSDLDALRHEVESLKEALALERNMSDKLVQATEELIQSRARALIEQRQHTDYLKEILKNMGK